MRTRTSGAESYTNDSGVDSSCNVPSSRSSAISCSSAGHNEAHVGGGADKKETEESGEEERQDVSSSCPNAISHSRTGHDEAHGGSGGAAEEEAKDRGGE